MSKIIYLAIPYTWNAELSFKIANEVAAQKMKEGHTVFSPISHSHPISKNMTKKEQFDQELWMRQDLPMLRKCDELLLVSIGKHGDHLISTSKGCQRELSEAKIANIPISHHLYTQIALRNIDTKEQALRYNNDKLKWSLMDHTCFESMIKVLEMGAKKYSKDNWKKGMPLSEVFESMLRHIFSMLNGEMIDKESKLSHIGHIQCNTMFIDYILRKYPKFNDIKK